jgi:hypothetical protein
MHLPTCTDDLPTCADKKLIFSANRFTISILMRNLSQPKLAKDLLNQLGVAPKESCRR